jgi:hypothetical protein
VPTPKPLTPEQAKRTLAHRFGQRADRLRQLATRFGIRPQRCFLVWTRWSGKERGEGDETILLRVEILPTPRVTDSAALTRRPWSGGILPEGSQRVDRISVQFTQDNLSGRVMPTDLSNCYPASGGPGTPVAGTRFDPKSDPQTDFFYELVEDGRGDDPADRQRFRVLGRPWRDAGGVNWAVMLEEASETTDRNGNPQVGDDDVPFDADDT